MAHPGLSVSPNGESREKGAGPPTTQEFIAGLHARMRELLRQTAEDNAAWAEQMRNVRDQERRRFEAQIELATWNLNAANEAMRVLRERLQSSRLESGKLKERLEHLQEANKANGNNLNSPNNGEVARLREELRQIREWKQDVKIKSLELTRRFDEIRKRYNELQQYDRDLTARLEAASEEIRQLRKDLEDCTCRVKTGAETTRPQPSLLSDITKIKRGLDVARQEMEKAIKERELVKTAYRTSPPENKPKLEHTSTSPHYRHGLRQLVEDNVTLNAGNGFRTQGQEGRKLPTNTPDPARPERTRDLFATVSDELEESHSHAEAGEEQLQESWSLFSDEEDNTGTEEEPGFWSPVGDGRDGTGTEHQDESWTSLSDEADDPRSQAPGNRISSVISGRTIYDTSAPGKQALDDPFIDKNDNIQPSSEHRRPTTLPFRIVRNGQHDAQFEEKQVVHTKLSDEDGYARARPLPQTQGKRSPFSLASHKKEDALDTNRKEARSAISHITEEYDGPQSQQGRESWRMSTDEQHDLELPHRCESQTQRKRVSFALVDDEYEDIRYQSADQESQSTPSPEHYIQTREGMESYSPISDKDICGFYKNILREIEEIIENKDRWNWYIYTSDDSVVYSHNTIQEEGKNGASHRCFLCQRESGRDPISWTGVATRDRKLRARSKFFELLYDMLLAHCEWTQADEGVEEILGYISRPEVSPTKVQNWTTTTYNLLPSQQPGPEVAVDATRKIFEYFLPILSPNATRSDRLELLKRISKLCHATHNLGKKIYKSRIYELRRVPPLEPGAVSLKASWVDPRFVEDVGTPDGDDHWASDRSQPLALAHGEGIAYGLSAAILKHNHINNSGYYGSSIIVLEKAQVVLKRRVGWRKIIAQYLWVFYIVTAFSYWYYIW